MNDLLWQPSAQRVAASRLTAFSQAVGAAAGWSGSPDYRTLHQWSVDHRELFWNSVWDFCGVVGDKGSARVLEHPDVMPGGQWFPDARLNFAENLLNPVREGDALISVLEDGSRRRLSWQALRAAVAGLAASMREAGIGKGDRVAGFMPNIPETIIAMLASSSLGAVWSSCSPDFGFQGVLDRFGQIAPRLLICADGYQYNGRTHDCLARVARLSDAIPTLENVLVVPLLDASPDLSDIANAHLFNAWSEVPADLRFEPLPFDHPLYIMYSSGTTGVPKCIVHGAGGTLLQHLKEHQLACDIGADDVLFYFTTCGWMMWNWLVSGLASGATLVLYDGSPFADDGRRLLDLIDEEEITVFGTSARYIAGIEKAGLQPVESHSLASLRTILSTGSPLSHESFDYVYQDVKPDVCLASIAGGTDIISCFVGGCPWLPVYRGEIQCKGLGMAVAFYDDDGNALAAGKGELVCTRSFPSMPTGFWNDPEGSKYHDAYFSRFPNIWCHGDFGELTVHEGVIIHGRSDAVLNPGGVRIGTAEIYRQVEQLDEVVESIVIGQAWQDDVRVVLFVVLREGVTLTSTLEDRIRSQIRQNTTPRHVPAVILPVADIPRTISGKIVELAVRNIIHGQPVKNTDALANPEALEYFRDRPELAV